MKDGGRVLNNNRKTFCISYIHAEDDRERNGYCQIQYCSSSIYNIGCMCFMVCETNKKDTLRDVNRKTENGKKQEMYKQDTY